MNKIGAKLYGSLLACSVTFALAVSTVAAAQTAPVAAAPMSGTQTAPVAQTPCCGIITSDGSKLKNLLDSMHVEQLWQAHLHINWETGEPDEPANYKGPGRSTHCSAFAAAVGERLNVYLLRPPDHSQIFLASAQAEWFHSDQAAKEGWRPLAGTDREQRAQELANRGKLVVIVYESPDPHKPGHIVIVRPSEKTAVELRTEGPQVTQAGAENHDSFIAAEAFNHHPGAWPDGVQYYWHEVEWNSLNVKTAP